ncbi:MAG TPA: tRNA 2-thiouridine(34) synthase MnmA [Candidatus Paceibacterota bacterium]|nr:tRNA 2-thiouridine(34) synthase MnmA [Candidatus Paceibacterota bacterium]
MQKLKKRVIVGMSGGIDSAMTLYLLQKEGYDVMGVSLRFGVWNSEKNLIKENVCCSSGAFLIAKNICNLFGVPYEIVDVKADFKNKVVKYFTSNLKKNKTPNPCVMCNRLVKIRSLIDLRKKYKADFVATGHYAKVVFNKSKKIFELKTSKDKNKDQTYFLSQLTQNQIKYLKLPLGKYLKEDVYKMANKLGIKFFNKTKQSQDFCFVANKSYNDFLVETLNQKRGLIVDEEDKKLGEHQSLHFYTIGQRKGINLSGGPFYVLDKDQKHNKLVVTKNKNLIFKKEFFIKAINLISNVKNAKLNNKEILVQIRYGDKKEKAKIKMINKDKFKIILNKPKMAITPGQFAVMYDKNTCLGSGVIETNK